MIPLSQNIAIEIQQARNQHSFRSIVLLIFSLLNIVITFVSVSKLGLIGTTVGYIFSLVFGYGIVMNWYYIRVMKLNIKFFWKKMAPSILPVIASALICKTIISIGGNNNIYYYFAIGVLYCVVYIIFIIIFIPRVLRPIINLSFGRLKK